MVMDRRTFLISTGVTGIFTLMPSSGLGELTAGDAAEAFSWDAGRMRFSFSVDEEHLRQHILLPAETAPLDSAVVRRSGVEVALLCSGEDSPDSGMKQAGGTPGVRLKFVGKREEKTSTGRRLILQHRDAELRLEVESYYEAFDGCDVVRRHVEVRNKGTEPVGIEYLSSAMLHGMADGIHYEPELKIWLAYNSWMAEGQWHGFRPSELGFVENMRTSWSQASASSVGSWSTEKYLPMTVVENTRLGVAWFWQIEHNGSWYWEISNQSYSGQRATDVYAYLGGPDQLHAQAWKSLKPGESYKSVPVAIGCVRGGFEEATQALTTYRQSACVPKRPAARTICPVIFNDYMNCLLGDPTEAKELPLIDAAAAAGCEYFVIDAGWYAEVGEQWWSTVGLWQASKTRWPNGLRYVMDRIRERGMVPGLWIEAEVVGIHSPLAQKPDSWFFMRHGKRVEKNSRLLLDFRNPDVRDYLNTVIERMVKEYGAGYIKIDYNVDTLEGTEEGADSLGQGLLEHNRAVLSWLDGLLSAYPELVIENCGSGGGRMDYAMLSHTNLQSCTDQEEYLRMPAIATGASACVAPSQLAVWSYPLKDADADQASFNMVSAMLLRIHQSGHLGMLQPEAAARVMQGVQVYKERIREHIPEAVPFYPLGMPDVTRPDKPVALGMRSPKHTFVAVWCIEGEREVRMPVSGRAELLYPKDLAIEVLQSSGECVVRFPRNRMGCILAIAL